MVTLLSLLILHAHRINHVLNRYSDQTPSIHWNTWGGSGTPGTHGRSNPHVGMSIK